MTAAEAHYDELKARYEAGESQLGIEVAKARRAVTEERHRTARLAEQRDTSVSELRDEWGRLCDERDKVGAEYAARALWARLPEEFQYTQTEADWAARRRREAQLAERWVGLQCQADAAWRAYLDAQRVASG